MKKFLKMLTAALSLLLVQPALAQPTDLFISEYVEGSGFNKAIEIYNGTGASINLATGQYVLEVYFNGSSGSTSLALTGSIPSGSVFILAHSSAVLPVVPDVSTNVINFNGDDAVVLRKGGAGGTIVDVIGQVGLDPGTQWGSNDTCTLDRTIRRKSSVCQGDITPSNVFYISQEWDGYPLNTFGGLGSHTVSCTTPPPPVGGLSLSVPSLSFTSVLNMPSLPQAYAITGNTLTAPVTITVPALFELSENPAGPFNPSLSIPQSSFSTNAVTVYVRYTPSSAGNHTATADHSSGAYTATLNLSGTSLSLTPINQIQGTAMASSYTNQTVATEGIVTGDFQGTNELGGFFIQDAMGDNNPATSEGIFISNTSYPVNPGDHVTLIGTVEEYFNRTQIKALSSLSIQSTSNSITPVIFSLPVSTTGDFEQLEGMRVKFTQTLTVSEVYTLARYGEILLSSNGRLVQPTNFVDPNDAVASGTTSTGSSNVAAVSAQQNLNTLNQITLDDHSNVQNPPVVPYVDPVNNTLRCGSTIADLEGVMDYAFSLYRIQPVATPTFTYAPRPSVPSVGAHNVKVASFNVLNYFNGDGAGGGFPTSRGANTALEFSRQRDKIISAITQIDADVLGLMEMENDGNGPQSAIADLVNGLNLSIGAGTYTFVADPTPSNGGTGTDEIKVALIYKPSVLTSTGSSIADNNSAHNRPPLAQTFILNSNQEKFSVVVNHFKSKGCTGSSGNNTDQLDGQSCFNGSRKLQATALLNFITTVKTQAVDNDVIAIGDFNAYEQEDPIDMLIAGGLTHLLNNSYSYVYMGQSGSLDHAFVSPSLAGQVSGADKWHINADEPVAKDYNQEFNPAYMYTADPFRSSDHDPVIIGLGLAPSVTISVTAVSNVSCNGSANGSATLSISGGEGPLTYTWIPSGGNTPTGVNLSAGTYTFAATDGTNVSTKTISVTQPSAISASVSAQSSVTCPAGNNGMAAIAASGGTGSFTYSWTGNSATTSSVSTLQAGTYTVTIQDANLCFVTQTLSIAQPPAATLTVIGSSSVTCNGLSNGSATLSAAGGNGNMTYSWSPSGGTGLTASSLAAGIYTLQATDASLCVTSKTIAIIQPQLIALNLTGATPVSCYGLANGSATVAASGGNGNFTYSWSPAGGTGATATALAAGIYTLTVKDANMCTASKTVNITQPAMINVSTSASGHTLSANASGVSYQWISCSNNNAPVQGANGQSFVPAIPGSYAVIVTENTCSDTSACTTILLTGINEATGNGPRLLVYPNPVNSDLVFIETDKNITFELIDQLGRVMITGSFENGTHPVNITGLSAGVYSLKANSATGQKTIKLIKTE